ncbi:MAG: single-stranded DNA-binding protein, partial [Proteobacteria bacterium]|nr:single-stranded DNA-binding protein [Pseudomonadota bacterium]
MNGIECAFTGKLGQAPELRTSKAGKAWCALSVRVGDGDGAQWVRVAVFGEMANAAVGLEKGTSVYVEGSLTLNIWTGASGEPRS